MNSSALDDLLRHPNRQSVINYADTSGRTPLYFAVKKGFPPLVSILLRSGALADSTTLCAAVEMDSLSMVRSLLGNANVNGRDRMGWTPLQLAITGNKQNSSTMIYMLLRNGADVNARSPHGLSSLHHAVDAGSKYSIISSLLNAGSDLYCRDAEGMTPLHYASMGGHLDLTYKLLLRDPTQCMI